MADMYEVSTDHELLERYKDGDATAFNSFYERHEKRLFSFVKHLALNSAMAEDCFQTMWLKVINKLDHILESTNRKPKVSDKNASTLWTLYPYLKTMAFRTVMDALKRKHMKMEMSGDEPAHNETDPGASYLTLVAGGRDTEPEVINESEQGVAKFNQALHALSDDQSQAWLLSREGFSLEESAVIQNVSIDGFRSRLRRAKEKLEPVLNEVFPDWKGRTFTAKRSKS